MNNSQNNIVTAVTMGGIGNNLFQIANAFSYSIDHNKNLVLFADKHYESHHKPISIYKQNLLRNVVFEKISKEIHFNTYTEPSHSYKKIPFITNNVLFFGYYQSDKYFKHNQQAIKKLFDFEIDKHSDYLNLINQEETCAMHIRRGDYLNLQDHHPVQPISYYRNGVEIIGSDKLYLVFSNDIDWCKEHINTKNIGATKICYIENTMPYEDLFLMKKCNHYIIANSSFSWWGSWLNDRPQSKTIAPNKWFGPAYESFNSDDNYCEHWIRL